MDSFKKEVEELVTKHKKEVFGKTIKKLYSKENLTDEDILLIFECVRVVKSIENPNECEKSAIELLGATNYYLSNENLDKKSIMYISILYGEINSLNNKIKEENRYLLDLGIAEEYDFFFEILKYLLVKGSGVRANELTSKLNITYEELSTFYFFQESISYINRLGDNLDGIKEENYPYYITARGIEAYKNLLKEKNKEHRINEEYNKHCSRHGYEEVPYYENSKNIKQYGGRKNNE